MRQLLVYYAVGIVNTLFGYGVYAALVFVGMNMFVAQFVATVVGVVFNYFTYSRAVFRGSRGAIGQFIVAYIVQYLFSLGALAGLSRLIPNPYLAGLGALIVTSLVFYLLLKRWVFRRTVARRVEQPLLRAFKDR